MLFTFWKLLYTICILPWSFRWTWFTKMEYGTEFNCTENCLAKLKITIMKRNKINSNRNNYQILEKTINSKWDESLAYSLHLANIFKKYFDNLKLIKPNFAQYSHFIVFFSNINLKCVKNWHISNLYKALFLYMNPYLIFLKSIFSKYWDYILKLLTKENYSHNIWYIFSNILALHCILLKCNSYYCY